MKKIILFVIALFAIFTAQAQNNRSVFVCGTPQACASSMDTLLQGAKRVYKLLNSYEHDNRRQILEYETPKANNNDIPIKMRVVFLKRTIGANPALEQSGQIVYELQSISGKYLDIFPIWKQYIDNTANMEAIAERGYSDRSKFDNGGGAGEEYRLTEDKQDKSVWVFHRSCWYTTSQI